VAAAAEVLGASGSSTSSPEHATPTTNRTASTANTRREGIGAHTKHDPARNDNPTLRGVLVLLSSCCCWLGFERTGKTRAEPR
jgi:hypothetical protein